jgi:hypothetical protein
MSADTADNELTPREFGLLAGHTWGLASESTSADGADPAERGIEVLDLVDSTFQTDVTARMAEFPDAAEAESEFWHAFAHAFELSSSRTWRGSSTGADRGTAGVGAPIRR